MHRALLLLASLLALLACDSGLSPVAGPVSEERAADEVSSRLCHAWTECACGEAAGVSLAGCDTGISFSWQARSEDAAEDGLTYDGDCLARRLNAMLERGCATAETFFPGCGVESCLIFHGSVPEGGDCDGGVSSSNCEQGLICLGTCQLPCDGPTGLPVPEGERCLDMGAFVGVCETGLLCDPESELCASLPGDGAPCLLNQCAELHYCDFASTTCARQGATGSECALPQECESLTCEEGSCAPPPGEGETCLGVCAGELVCARDELGALSCSALPGVGATCLADFANRCQDGLACVDDTCVTPPGNGQPCIDPTAGSAVVCAGELICGARLCSASPSTPGCEDCTDPDGSCVVRICMPEPAAVCSDSGGLLY